MTGKREAFCASFGPAAFGHDGEQPFILVLPEAVSPAIGESFEKLDGLCDGAGFVFGPCSGGGRILKIPQRIGNELFEFLGKAGLTGALRGQGCDEAVKPGDDIERLQCGARGGVGGHLVLVLRLDLTREGSSQNG
ncbi:hypothetical protein [Pannonibacter indicus]|uniref:hypothetical protein n=1 Tax=Pannonibacter indicus TaxID=466044 RepID=UPI00391B108B